MTDCEVCDLEGTSVQVSEWRRRNWGPWRDRETRGSNTEPERYRRGTQPVAGDAHPCFPGPWEGPSHVTWAQRALKGKRKTMGQSQTFAATGALAAAPHM